MKDIDVDHLLSLAIKASSDAVNYLRNNYLQDAVISSSKNKDIKTEADKASQECIKKYLRLLNIDILAEEDYSSETNYQHTKWGITDKPLWIVDPLDGTLNFTRGFEMASVSIGLWLLGKPLLGVIQNIYTKDIYSGIVGKGAWLNGKPITVSERRPISESILVTGFPSGRNYDTQSLSKFVKHVQTYKKVRMLGCASLMIAMVASGKFDAYEEEDIYLWDVAAGLAIVEAAGGGSSYQMNNHPFKLTVRAFN